MLIRVNFDPNWAKSRGWLFFCEWTFFCKATVANNYYLVLSPPELIIMSDGENIPPVPIENRIKNEIPFLSNVMVVGDQRDFLACLMTLKVNFHIIYICKKCYFNHIFVTLLAFLLCASHVKFKDCLQFESECSSERVSLIGEMEYGMEWWNEKWNGTMNVHSYS